MENAADALKMAAAMLVFVVALSISIYSLSEARQSAETVLSYQDRETDYTYYSVDSANLDSECTRTVNAETIIPTIYRAYKENCKIMFNINSLKPINKDYPLYTKRDNKGNTIAVNYIDLENETLASETKKLDFLEGIIYHKYSNYNNSEADFFKAFFGNYTAGNNTSYSFSMSSDSLYNRLISQSLPIKESVGVYYQEDEIKTNDDGTTTTSSESTTNANKTKKRVITYFLN